jgi:selenium-binding protein 1
MITKNNKRKQTLIVLIAVALLTLTVGVASADGFTHAPVFNVDGEEYYMDGAPDGPDGATDIPGHNWVQAGPNQVVGKHYNTGPFGMPQWWSSDAPDGELLFIVHGIIDTWSKEKAASYAARGYVHYHELVSVNDGSLHPDKVVWLKHTARTSFDFDGGPHPELAHEVTPGVDYDFIPNGMMEYLPLPE